MNLKDISQFKLEDLKNVNYLELKDQILSRPDVIINSAIIIVTLIISLNAYNGYNKKSININKNITEIKTKLDALKQQENIQLEYKQLLTNEQKRITIESLGDKLGQFAKTYNITIASFDPGKPKDSQYIYSNDLKIKITANNYENFILFLKEAEETNYSFRLKTFSAAYPTTQRRRDEKNDPNDLLSADLYFEIVENKDAPIKTTDEENQEPDNSTE